MSRPSYAAMLEPEFLIGDIVEVHSGTFKESTGTVKKVTKIQMEVEWISGVRQPIREPLVPGSRGRVKQSNARRIRRPTPPPRPVRICPDYNEGMYLSQVISYRRMIREEASKIHAEMDSLIRLLDSFEFADAERIARITASVTQNSASVTQNSGSSRRKHRRRRG